ncbi:MAG: Rieske 2Fe-2S domain-containing protein [Thiobacillaceae bacterium]
MSLDRRTFIRTCAGTVAGAAVIGTLTERLAMAGDLVTYTKSRLVGADGQPLKASALSTAEAYFFDYPMKSLPCLLIRLGTAADPTDLKTAAGDAYSWQGGVGPNKDIVAYSAICSHQLAYPTKAASVMAYQAEQSDLAGRKGVITCCAHNSVFDPAKGAAVTYGPATQPLAAVKLEYNAADDSLSATGVYGGTLFDDFLKTYKGDLMEQYGRGEYKSPAPADVVAVLLSAYSGAVVTC